MTEQQRRAMYAGAIPAIAQAYEMRETPGAWWYKTENGEKYRKDKKTGNWRIIKGTLATFTKFLETNTNIIF